MSHLEFAAQQIAADLTPDEPDGLGSAIVIAEIASLVLQSFISCYKAQHPDATPMSAKDDLGSHYDPTTKTFSATILDRCRHHTKRAARRQCQRHLSADQLDDITTASLRRVLEMDDSGLASCAAEAGTFTVQPDGDDDATTS
jgi:hypothetical protein